MFKFESFRQFVEMKETFTDNAKDIILDFFDATEDALENKLSSYENYEDLLEDPPFKKIVDGLENKSDVIKAVQDADNSEITILNLINMIDDEESEP